ncbi:SMP-30/gluconolactonase/LRE family protein [Sphingobium sp. EP60837]|uniref:SMP-30/gluconolactonase/LRE family protein n=1 Tax=Sphingobium sp. EP60837 TaxID=1855519 RepID=UPI0007DD02EF|nr:hypothetical protein [Sphingobium sp. EP60837]ANI80094.1 hypothetical protein EP837_03712 [Sphingobium sp. EP60837]
MTIETMVKRCSPLLVLASVTSCALTGAQSGINALGSPRLETIQIADRNVFPESITSTRAGAVIIGSLAQPYIYRASPGEAIAQRWIDLTPFGSISYGVLADEPSRTLWTCTVISPRTGERPPPLTERHSTLRAYDLETGSAKGAWPLPGQSNACNDIAIGPEGIPYVSDLGNGRILRLRGNGSFELFYSGPQLNRVDGLAFLGKDLYATNLESGQIFRLTPGRHGPVISQPLQISVALNRPDGLRSYGGRLYLADNGLGKVFSLTVKGTRATAENLRDGLERPTGVTRSTGKLWMVESKTDHWDDGADPNPFTVRSVPLPPSSHRRAR